MKIVVTGGAGFIGSHVVEAYIAAGHQVLVVDSLVNGSLKNLPSLAKTPNLSFSKVSLTSPKLGSIIASFKPTVINHHAAEISVTKSMANPIADAKTNIVGTIHLAEIAKKTKSVKQFIFASSGGAVYGETTKAASESSAISPSSAYGVAKASAELYLSLYTNNFQVTVLRYSNVYGPRQNIHGEAGVVSLFCSALLHQQPVTIFGDGKQTRDYVYVGDVATANILATSNANNRGYQVFNISSNKPTTTLTVFSTIVKTIGTKQKPLFGQLRPGEVGHSLLANTVAQKRMGWIPSTPFQKGLQAVVSWLSH